MRECNETIPSGNVVKALTGRDSGRWFLIVGEQKGPYLQLVDGRTRHMTNPKKKNIRHVRNLGKPADAPQILKSIEEMRDDGQKEAAIRTYIGRYRQLLEQTAHDGDLPVKEKEEW